MNNAEKKVLAESLFLKSSMNRKEIAEQIGVTEKTLRNWIDAGNWDAIKDSHTITRNQLLNNAYFQLNSIDNEIREKHNGIPNKQLSDAQGVLIKKIEALSSQPIHKSIEVFEEFLNYLFKHQPQDAKKFAEYSQSYIKSIIKSS